MAKIMFGDNVFRQSVVLFKQCYTAIYLNKDLVQYAALHTAASFAASSGFFQIGNEKKFFL